MFQRLSTRVSPRLLGIGCMCLALMCFSGLDSTAKWLNRELPVAEVAFARYTVAFLLIAIVHNPIRAPEAWRTPRPVLQLIRALALLGSTAGNFIALLTMPLADVMAVNFSAPFLIALLAGPMLGEYAGWRQWLAIGVGFLGVLVVTRPGAAGFNPAILWALVTVVCNAIYSLTTRQLSTVATTSNMLVTSAGTAAVLLAPILPFVWVSPQHWTTWLLLLQLGTFGFVGHYFMIRAYTLAPAPVIAPFTYTQMIWAASIGYFVFGDVPGLNTIIGAGIVILSGLYLLMLETRRRAPDPLPPGE